MVSRTVYNCDFCGEESSYESLAVVNLEWSEEEDGKFVDQNQTFDLCTDCREGLQRKVRV